MLIRIYEEFFVRLLKKMYIPIIGFLFIGNFNYIHFIMNEKLKTQNIIEVKDEVGNIFRTTGWNRC